VLSHKLVGINQQSFDSTFSGNVSFSAASFAIEYGLLYVKQGLTSLDLLRMKRW